MGEEKTCPSCGSRMLTIRYPKCPDPRHDRRTCTVPHIYWRCPSCAYTIHE